jgi:ElaB/YqjD/DUF883 family membrane-anchored ribosome-binding protein
MPANAVDYTTDEAKAAARAASDTASTMAADAQRSFAEAAKHFEQVVHEGMEQIRAQSRAYADTAGQQLDDAQRYVVERVKERPLAATGAALGIGVLVGLLLAAGRNR